MIIRCHRLVIHTFPPASSHHTASTAKIGQVPRDLGLALSQDLHEITDTHFLTVHQVQQPETGAIGERGKQQRQVVVLREIAHLFIIYALTDTSTGEYIRFSICEEIQSWNLPPAFRNRSRKSTEAPRGLWLNPATCR